MTAKDFTQDSYQTAQNKTLEVAGMGLEFVEAKVKTGFFEPTSGCYVTEENPESLQEIQIYDKIEDNGVKPQIYQASTDDLNRTSEEPADVNCVSAKVIEDDKAFYFEGLTQTGLWVGICGAVIYVVCIICVWVCCWKDKKNNDQIYINSAY